MLTACTAHFAASNVTVMSAAVADYTPIDVSLRKIKKEEDLFDISLKKTTDILATLGAIKANQQLLVGFALETDDEETHAREKLRRKNLDLIILNSLNDKGAGFKSETNKITIFSKTFEKKVFNTKLKTAVARDICREIIALLGVVEKS